MNGEQNKNKEVEGKQTREGEMVKGADASSTSISAPDNILKISLRIFPFKLEIETNLVTNLYKAIEKVCSLIKI
jgi:hypothetical protein